MGRGIWSRAGAEAVERLDLPPELAYGVPQIELMGQQQFLMAHHKGVLSYSTQLVEISGGDLVVRLTGRDLQLLAMTEEELRLGGVIEKVELVNLCTEK
ncbi:MAG: sporulation protein [Ruminococcaceae bacterium]|nr:sporulation protein [Oscillospiraceae bacterium]